VNKKSNIYWYCQIFGWSFYILINLIFFGLKHQSNYKDYLIHIWSLLVAIGITHVYRLLILQFNVLELKIPMQLLLIIFSSLLLSVTFYFHTAGLFILLGIVNTDLSYVDITELIINNTVPFFIWNIIYFGFKHFQNYKKAEINSLRYLAASKDSELSSLKAQLNPHFMFNSMNSIRALVDENPVKAKDAITQLSGILRNTLLMNKNRLILLSEEIDLVRDYLNLEQIRYEERLSYEFKIEEEVNNCRIPPFIIQSQVENAIKHGISKLPGNGKIIIEAFILGSFLKIKVSNTGKISHDTPLTGVGFKNSIQRLGLLYGNEGQIFISEVNNLVVVDINIPLKKNDNR
jgi:two-component system LytT family sensor kinase